MEVHHSQATSTVQQPLTFSYINDYLPNAVLTPSEYGSDCSSLPADISIATTTELTDDSGLYIPASLKTLESERQSEYHYSQEENYKTPNSEDQIPKNCGHCQLPIRTKTLLNVDGRHWHEACLRCEECQSTLDNFPSCYFRKSKFYCKPCYGKSVTFGSKCATCERVIHAADWVRRAKNYVYHLACFACDQCKRQLSTGEEYTLSEGKLLCKQHYTELLEGEAGIAQQKAKTKRVRTTFAEEQLSVLQAHFQIDSNPDGADLEKIANITGLSKRVTQVWFQNSRARQKKYQGHRKGSGEENEDSRRSSMGPMSPGQKSDVSNDMIYPTSVTTSADEVMSDSSMPLTSMQFD